MLIFLILGISNGGLFMARQVREEWPNAVIYAIGNPKDIGRYSNTINLFFAASTEDEILSSIDEVHRLVKGDRIHAYMCSNPMLECLVIHHPEVFEHLTFENGSDLYRRIVDKTMVNLWCRKLGIARPEEYSLKEQDHSSISFPVVVKPLEKANTIGASKCAYLNNQEALVNYLNKTDGLGIRREDLVCQRCVQGDNRWEYGYGGYFNDGEPIVDICFHQFVQVPQGLSCYIREVSDEVLSEKIKSMVIPFVRHFKYTGIIEFDLKADEKTKQIYVLDINPRPWRSVDMLSAKLGQSTIFRPVIQDTFVIWRHPYREMMRRANSLNVKYKECRVIANRMNHKMVFMSFDRRDLRPFVWQCHKDVNDFISRLKRRLFG